MKYIKEFRSHSVKITRRDYEVPIKINCIESYSDLIEGNTYETDYRYTCPIDGIWHFHIPELKGSYETKCFEIINI